MFRTYIRIKYKYNPCYDSEYYKQSAYIINRSLMRKLDKETPKESIDSFGEIYISTKSQMTIEEMKKVIKYLWESVVNNGNGCYGGFYYKDLRPGSFTVSIQEVSGTNILQTTREVCELFDNIIECFAMQDTNRVLDVYDTRKQEIEKNIKTIADCL